MKRIFTVIILVVLTACGGSKNAAESMDGVNPDYGYKPKDPIIVGGQDLRYGPEYETNYLKNLSGPNGEEISYTRLGSCCEFPTSKGIMGSGLLDKYEVTYKGLEEPIILYFNMYDPAPEERKAPVGLKFKKE